jgi:hypothetical protein
LKKLASTETRLTSFRIARVSANASWPKIRASPPSLIRSVDSSRTSVDLPDALAPLDRERDRLQRRHRLAPREAAGLLVAPPELLRQVDDLDRGDVTADVRVLRCG